MMSANVRASIILQVTNKIILQGGLFPEEQIIVFTCISMVFKLINFYFLSRYCIVNSIVREHYNLYLCLAEKKIKIKFLNKYFCEPDIFGYLHA